MKGKIQLVSGRHSVVLIKCFLFCSLEFKSKKIRVMLNAPIKAEQKAESSDVMKTVDEDRKLLIQSVIVR